MHVCFQCLYLQQYIPILQKNKNILREYEKQLHISEDYVLVCKTTWVILFHDWW